jgi:hypothetical protein
MPGLRQLVLHLMTGGATLLLLAALSVPALHAMRDAGAVPPPTPQPAAHPYRVFGTYVDPWHVTAWSRGIGAAPQAVAKFEAFSRRRTLDEWGAETRRQGIRRMLVSWEPWTPVPAADGLAAQARAQPGYRNVDIARGAQDGYILRFARSLARFRGTVYLRYAHEMNGYWYPWSTNPSAYRAAWRRVVRLFRVAGARNVRFVWSVNPNLYEPEARWLRNLWRYWPGRRYVDAVGTTMIDFGGAKDYAVARFVPRFRALHRTFGAPVVLTETNTQWYGRLGWLRDLRQALAGMPWIRALMWSQLPSRGAAHRGGGSLLDWDVRTDAAAALALADIIGDGVRR